MAIIGPGSVEDDMIAPTPTLDGATEFEYITILNPLTDDFAIKVAQDVPVNMPFEIKNKTSMVQNENDIVRSYGLGLKNPDHQSRKHITNSTIIPSGKTINLKGNEAQVAVRQLVNEIMQREGNKLLLADPHLRKSVEDRIIRARGSVQELMDSNIQTPRSQVDEAINRSNEVEYAFPGLSQPIQENVTGVGDVGSTDSSPKKRAPGRPRKVEQS